MDSDSDYIDTSIVADNRTVFVAETDEDSSTEVESEDEVVPEKTPRQKVSVRTSSIAESHVISSSEEDISRRVSEKLDTSPQRVILSSSDEEEEISPELLPRRRPPLRPLSNHSRESPVIRKTKKRMMIVDSDTENSIVIDHDKNTKITCLKDTPIRVAVERNDLLRKSFKNLNTSEVGSDSDNNSKIEDDNAFETSRVPSKDVETSEDENNIMTDDSHEEVSHNKDASGDETNASDGPDEDEMVFSKATRMSIMGMVPQDDGSDDSDFIQSDESKQKSRSSSQMSNFSDLPDTGLSTTVPVTRLSSVPIDNISDSSRISCSPISSPVRPESNSSYSSCKVNDDVIVVEGNRRSTGSKISNVERISEEKHIVYDDDVTIIDTKPEVIALSSDDEEETTVTVKKSPQPVKEEPVRKGNGIQQYMLPESYPNQVKYVKKSVRENELQKLERLKADLYGVRTLLDRMDISSLPDKGLKFIERLSSLELQVRKQGDLVANMLLEPENPTVDQMKNDGFENIARGLTWDDLAKGSNAVQPKWAGKQGMATHMAERGLIVDRLHELHKSLATRPPETQLADTPQAIKSELMPHQRHALEWLAWRETQNPPTGILADDMGLGKTVTMIALIARDKEKVAEDDSDDDDFQGKGRLARGGTLVVCPASLIQQWAAEVNKHCKPHQLSVTLHHGPNRATQPGRLAASDIVVTTYNILLREKEKTGVLMRILWRRIILDEAHIVRNHKASTSVSVCSLRGRRRWCLTGTPVQNKELDLFALVKFLRVSPFHELAMWKKWIDNKSIGGQDRLNTITASILLRRTKAQLQQKGQLNCLPERSLHVVDVALTKEEMNVYQKVLVFSKTLFAQFLHQRAEKEADSRGFSVAANQDTAYAKMHKKMLGLQGAKPVKSHEILVLLLRLRQVCCHCGLIAAMLEAEDSSPDVASTDLLAELNKLTLQDEQMKETEDPDLPPETPEEGTSVAEAIRSVMSANNPVFNLQNKSSKIAAVMKCLQENVFSRKDEKAVVVSQWTSVLRLVEDQLKILNVKSVTLSGSVPVNQRHLLVDKINDPRSDTKVMLLSLCAGGVGLNLCGASHLLLLDPHWNPQLEAQAQDRVYRVGQARDVHLYRFVCTDTVEHTIRKLQLAKLELADNVMTGARNTNASKLTIEDLKMLFNMGN